METVGADALCSLGMRRLTILTGTQRSDLDNFYTLINKPRAPRRIATTPSSHIESWGIIPQ